MKHCHKYPSTNTQRIALAFALCLPMLAGCQVERHRVLAVTGTTIGISVAQNPQTQMYEGVLGYDRAEFAFVPTNRPTADEDTGDAGITGADESAEVLMEIRQGGIFSNNGSIYQRLAVGHQAVSQPGAWIMMAKGPDGTVDPNIARMIAENFQSVGTTDRDASAQRRELNARYSQAIRDNDDAALEVLNRAAASYTDAQGNRPYATYADFQRVLLPDDAAVRHIYNAVNE